MLEVLRSGTLLFFDIKFDEKSKNHVWRMSPYSRIRILTS
jgi:hypothetical protein